MPKPTDGRRSRSTPADFDRDALLTAVERVSSLHRDDFCGQSKLPTAIAANLIVAGRRLGANTTTLAALTNLVGRGRFVLLSGKLVRHHNNAAHGLQA